MLRLSVIVPTYNVERFVESCIRSLEAQDIDSEEYEIIVVDDGATDGSIARVIELQRDFDNIVLVHQSNGGLSAARNHGIRAARGTYLLFVDSDDCVAPNCFATMLSVAESHDHIDFVGFNYSIHFNSGLTITPKSPVPAPKPITGVEYYERFVTGNYYIWKYLFSREFLVRNDLFFLEGISYEDVELTPRLMGLARSTFFHDLPFYHYYLRPGSISTSRSVKHIGSRIMAAENLHRFMNEKGDLLNSKARVMFNDIIAESLLSAVSASHHFPNLLSDLSRRILELPFYPVHLPEGSKHRWEMNILNRSVGLFWVYSYVLSSYKKISSKFGTAVAVARGPSPINTMLGYSKILMRRKSRTA